MHVDILIDIPSREQVVASYVSHALTYTTPSMSVSTDLHGDFNKGTHYDFFARTRSPRTLIVTPSYNVRRTANVLARAVRQGALLAHQHSEQLFPEIYDTEKLNINQKSRYRRHIWTHLVWGTAFARKLIEQVEADPDRIFITGNPKLDLARRITARRRADARAERVLFASNFTLADLSDSGWESFKSRYGVSTDFPLHQAYFEIRKRCCDWLERAALSFPEVTFAVRPHPGEASQPYAALEHLPNVTIEGQGDFSTALANCSLLLCYSSTSIFEAMACGIPAYRLNVDQLPPELAQPPRDTFPWIGEAELHELLRSPADRRLPADFCLRADEHMHKPAGNSLLRTAIAIFESARRARRQGEPLPVQDKLCGLAHHIPPLAKDVAIRASAKLHDRFRVSNPIYRRTRAAFARRLASGELPTEEELASADRTARTLLTRAEVQVLLEKAYSLRRTSDGIHIELPHWADEGVAATTFGPADSQ